MTRRNHDELFSSISDRDDLDVFGQHSVFHPGFGHHQPTHGGGLQFRSIDGTGNNLTQPDLNAAGTDFARIGPAHFDDGFSTPIDGPNPREISNTVVAGQGDLANPEGLSGMMYAWGQFIDHDLDLSMSDGTSHIDITIPQGDPTFTPGSIDSPHTRGDRSKYRHGWTSCDRRQFDFIMARCLDGLWIRPDHRR